MLTVALVSGVVSGALIFGAVWGAIGPLSDRVIGFLVAFAGGSLVLSSVTELVEPAASQSTLTVAVIFLALGGVVFTGIDYVVDERWGSDSGGGLLAAISLDGLPENLALGVALIGAGAPEVAALAGSILLSNLPEAAGGARQMADDGRSTKAVIGLWTGTALVLSLSTVVGYVALEGASPGFLAAVRAFAAGAVIASLATEVFPSAYKEGSHEVGIATVMGLVLALLLGQIGS